MENFLAQLEQAGVKLTSDGLKALENEGMIDLDILKSAREDDLRLVGLKVGDIIQIRNLIQRPNRPPTEPSLNDSSTSSDPASDGESDRMDFNGTIAEPNIRQLKPNKTEIEKFTAQELLGKATPKTKCTSAQLCFRNLLRDCAKGAKIWAKAYTLPSIPDGKLSTFLELIQVGAPQLKEHTAEVKVRLGLALQNRRKYLADLHCGKRKGKTWRNDDTPSGNAITGYFIHNKTTDKKSSKSDTSSVQESSSNHGSKSDASSIQESSSNNGSESDISLEQRKFNSGDEVMVFRTPAGKSLAFATYLGPKDVADINEMYSMLQLNKLNTEEEDICLPEETVDGATTLNELQENSIFVWKTKKLRLKTTKEPAKKKLKVMKNKNVKVANDQFTESASNEASSPPTSPKAFDGVSITLKQWVAVAYNEAFYIGQVSAINPDDKLTINFLTKKKGVYSWPKKKDMDVIASKFVFTTNIKLENTQIGLGTELHNEQSIVSLYEKYKKKYLE